jgi:hypothetical protein
VLELAFDNKSFSSFAGKKEKIKLELSRGRSEGEIPRHFYDCNIGYTLLSKLLE